MGNTSVETAEVADTVTEPADALTLIPLPAVMFVTPVFATVIEPEAFVTLTPVPADKLANVNPVPFPSARPTFGCSQLSIS